MSGDSNAGTTFLGEYDIQYDFIIQFSNQLGTRTMPLRNEKNIFNCNSCGCEHIFFSMISENLFAT